MIVFFWGEGGFVLAPRLAGTIDLLSISLLMGSQSYSSLLSKGQSVMPLQRNPSVMHGPFSHRNMLGGQMIRNGIPGVVELLVVVVAAAVVVAIVVGVDVV